MHHETNFHRDDAKTAMGRFQESPISNSKSKILEGSCVSDGLAKLHVTPLATTGGPTRALVRPRSEAGLSRGRRLVGSVETPIPSSDWPLRRSPVDRAVSGRSN